MAVTAKEAQRHVVWTRDEVMNNVQVYFHIESGSCYSASSAYPAGIVSSPSCVVG